MRILFAIFMALAVSGCVTTSVGTITELDGGSDGVTILIAPTDVELSEISAGGTSLVKAEWTEKATKHINASLIEFLQENGSQFKMMEDPNGVTPLPTDVAKYVKLHEAVAGSIYLHHYLQHQFGLPSKQGKFDWTLGENISALREQYGADYALFVHMRDSYATAGRKAAAVVAAILFRANIQTGTQVGYASLVDLKTGDVVWFDYLLRGTGDLRTADKASETVAALMKTFPK